MLSFCLCFLALKMESPMESKVVKRCGILKVVEEGNKFYLSLPGKELKEISSAREETILNQFETISTKVVGDFIIEVAKYEGKNYLIVKKEDILSTRGYDLVGVHLENKKVVIFRKGFFSSVSLPSRYTIINGKMHIA